MRPALERPRAGPHPVRMDTHASPPSPADAAPSAPLIDFTAAAAAKVRELIREVKTDVESGLPLATALGKHPLQFDNLYCNLVNAGEEAGVLDGILNKIAIYQEKSETIKAKVKKALLYPTIVLVVAFIVTAFILIFVIPQFEALFKGFGADLPAFTKMIVSASNFMVSYWWLILGIVLGAIMATWAGKWPDRLLSLGALLLYSTPGFWIGLMALVVFSEAGATNPIDELAN